MNYINDEFISLFCSHIHIAGIFKQFLSSTSIISILCNILNRVVYEKCLDIWNPKNSSHKNRNNLNDTRSNISKEFAVKMPVVTLKKTSGGSYVYL